MANGVPDLKLIDGDKIKDIEPYCEGLKALWSPHTGKMTKTKGTPINCTLLCLFQLGIVDFALVTQHYAGGNESIISEDLISFRLI